MPVVIEGVVGLRKALNKLAPDIKKELDKEVREALKPVIADARSKVPASAPGGLINWNNPGYERKSRTSRKRAFPPYDGKAVRKGLTYSVTPSRMRGTGFVSLFTLLNRSATGAIIETAGRKNPGGNPASKSNNPNAGKRFIGAMNGVGALKDYSGRGQMSTGRLLYAAYARNEGRALNAVLKAVQTAQDQLVARIKSSRKEVA
ncbi:MAG: hypothetical protein EB015_13335 [Methylocystaceae bacterium]|nr:hypothetical protein [Methylocystaceae bacterium]